MDKTAQAAQVSYLLIQVLKLGTRQLQLGDSGQNCIPSARVDVCNEAFHALHRIQRNLTLSLKGCEGVCESVLLEKLQHDLDNTAPQG